MLNATVELFLSEYFLFKAVLGKYCESSGDLFCALCKIFMIPESEAEILFGLAENETAKAITTDKDFMQYQRIQKYAEMIGTKVESNAEWEEVVRIKGNSLHVASHLNLVLDADSSRNVVYNCLISAATSGTVSAIRIMGILQCEGIFLKRNRKEGIKTLSKASDWNDSVSTLALLHYCKDTREFNMARLKQEVKNTPFEELYQVAAKKYGEAGMLEIEEVRLLNKSFNSGVLKRDAYDPKYARILNSLALYIRDKEKAVFSLNKEQLTAISELPLKLSQERADNFDIRILDGTPLKRDAETSAIARALKNSDLRELPTFRPLCLICDDIYILNMYAKAIGREEENTHVELIDVSALEDYDFEPTPNNVFIRSIDEDKDNRFLLFFHGEIPEKKIEAVKSILLSSRRAKFHLHSPNVTLNLSAVLPVCFCDEQNAKWLKSCCDEIRLSTVTAEELSLAVNDILLFKQKLYGLGSVVLTDDAYEALKEYDIDTAEKLIDSAVRAHRERGAKIVLSREMLQEHTVTDTNQIIGFGGVNHDRYH